MLIIYACLSIRKVEVERNVLSACLHGAGLTFFPWWKSKQKIKALFIFQRYFAHQLGNKRTFITHYNSYRTIIFNQEPYDNTDVTWSGIRLADALKKKGQQERIFLMNDAIDLARGCMQGLRRLWPRPFTNATWFNRTRSSCKSLRNLWLIVVFTKTIHILRELKLYNECTCRLGCRKWYCTYILI